MTSGILLYIPRMMTLYTPMFDPQAYFEWWERQKRSRVAAMFPDESITSDKAISEIEKHFAYIPVLCDPTKLSVSAALGPVEKTISYTNPTGAIDVSDDADIKNGIRVKASLTHLKISGGAEGEIPKTKIKVGVGGSVEYRVTNYKDCAHP